MEFRADLHCHTTCSDGTHSPLEVVDLARTAGLLGLALTDHDTIAAYDSAIPYAARRGIALITGVEFSCAYKGDSVHILGYSFSQSNEALLQFCERHKSRREKRFKEILRLLAKSGMPVTEEEVREISSEGMIGRPHIAAALVKKGYVRSLEEAFKSYLTSGKPCFVPGEAFSVEESIDILKQAGGFAVIAHPHLIKHPATLHFLLDQDFDGIEVYYSRFDSETNARWLDVANRKNWFVTGGSDFHGTVKPQIALGCAWAPEATFRMLHQHYKNISESQ